jgi:nitrogen-specific signal transduction histidine kinase
MADSAPRVVILAADDQRRAEAAKALAAVGCLVEQASAGSELSTSIGSGADVVLVDLHALDIEQLASALGERKVAGGSGQNLSAPTGCRTPESLRKLAHDLRTPLNAILGWAQLLKFGDLDDAMKQEALDTIERSAKAQAEMISNMLDLPPS